MRTSPLRSIRPSTHEEEGAVVGQCFQVLAEIGTVDAVEDDDRTPAAGEVPDFFREVLFAVVDSKCRWFATLPVSPWRQ